VVAVLLLLLLLLMMMVMRVAESLAGQVLNLAALLLAVNSREVDIVAMMK
jgi:hypothetical protein